MVSSAPPALPQIHFNWRFDTRIEQSIQFHHGKYSTKRPVRLVLLRPLRLLLLLLPSLILPLLLPPPHLLLVQHSNNANKKRRKTNATRRQRGTGPRQPAPIPIKNIRFQRSGDNINLSPTPSPQSNSLESDVNPTQIKIKHRPPFPSIPFNLSHILPRHRWKIQIKAKSSQNSRHPSTIIEWKSHQPGNRIPIDPLDWDRDG